MCGIQVGIEVWAKHSFADRYYKGTIQDVYQEQFYILGFADESFVDVSYSQILVSYLIIISNLFNFCLLFLHLTADPQTNLIL